jgi:hypothetical protein
MEIDGSHAHRLRPLIEKLGLLTLVITDLDATNPADNDKATVPARNASLTTSNSTLRLWHPCKTSVDDLLDLSSSKKVKAYSTPSFSVRIAYQTPTKVVLQDGGKAEEVLSTTFEDALVIENLELFKKLDDKGPIRPFHNAVATHKKPMELSDALLKAVDKCEKAAFALQLLLLEDPSALKVPHYIEEGLTWLQAQLKQKQDEVLEPVAVVEVSGA